MSDPRAPGSRDKPLGRALRVPLLCLVLASSGLSGVAHAEPLDIEQAIQLVRANHPKLARDRALIAAARARAQTAWSRFFPGVTGEFSYAPETPNYVPSPAFRRVLDRRTEGGVDNVLNTAGQPVKVTCVSGSSAGTCAEDAPSPLPDHSYKLYSFWTARVGLAWTAFDWGSTTYANRAAETAVEAREQRLSATLADVVQEAKLAYYDVLAAEASVTVASEELAARTRQLATVRALEQAGRNTGIDVASSESDVAAAELLLVRARAAIEYTRSLLALTIGDPSSRYRALVMPVLEMAGGGLCTEEAKRATDRRPEVHELMLEAKAQDAQSRAVRGAYLPAINVHAGPSWSGSQLDALIPNFEILVAMKYPSATGMNPLLVAGQRKEAEAMSASYQAQAQVVRNELRLQAETACIELSTAQQAVVAARKVVASAGKRREQADARYRQGVGTFLELSEAELSFTNARFDEVHANFAIGRAQSRVERALGQSERRSSTRPPQSTH